MLGLLFSVLAPAIFKLLQIGSITPPLELGAKSFMHTLPIASHAALFSSSSPTITSLPSNNSKGGRSGKNFISTPFGEPVNGPSEPVRDVKPAHPFIINKTKKVKIK